MARTHPGCTTLLDLPDELLSSCLPSYKGMPHDNPYTLRPSMAACKRLLEVLLKGGSSGTLGLRLQPVRDEDVPAMSATLQLMTKAFPDLHRVHFYCHERYLHEHLIALLGATKEPDTGCLTGITHLSVFQYAHASVSLPHPVPLRVAVAFPNLKELKLVGVSCNEQGQQQLTGQPAQPARLEQLRQLQLQGCSLCNSAAAFQQQLQQLPSLQELSLVNCKFEQAALQKEYAEAVAVTCSGRLKRIEWARTWNEHRLARLLSRPYAHLQGLLLRGTTVKDRMMELLLQHAPGLRKLQVRGFQLKQDYSPRHSGWESVVIHRSLDVASLARMPQCHAAKVLVTTDHPYIFDVRLPTTEGPPRGTADALQLTQAAAAAVKRCGGIQMSDGYGPGVVCIQVGADSPAQTDQVLLAALPMLHHITTCLHLSSVHVTKAVLQGFSSELPHCCTIQLQQGCTFEEGIWGVMVSLLPHVTDIEVSVQAATLHQLTVLCATATHPVDLLLQDCETTDADYEDEANNEWVAALRQAVIDAGHDYVDIDLEFPSLW